MLKPLAGDQLVLVGLGLVLKAGQNEGQMRFDGGLGSVWIAGLKPVVDGAVLVQQQFTRGALLEHHGAVVKHAFTQKIHHGPHHMQHDDVVARLNDCEVKFRIKGGFISWVSLGVGGFHLFENGINHGQIRI